MQVTRQDFWTERMLVYLCRNFSKLNHGDGYDKVNPVIHIGILDFQRLKDDTRLYSENVLTDKITGQVYSEKLGVNELSLKNIEHATEEERKNGLYVWAKFFAAKTWEELKMAAKSEAMRSAVVTIRKLTADERIRLQCEARERYERDILTWQSQIQTEKELRRKAEERIQKAEERTQKAEERTLEEKELRKLAEERTQKAEERTQKVENKLGSIYQLLQDNPSMSAEEILKNI